MPQSKSSLPVPLETALLLTVGEAGRLLGKSPNTVLAMIARGEIAATVERGSRRWVITRAEIDRYVRQIATDAELERRRRDGSHG